MESEETHYILATIKTAPEIQRQDQMLKKIDKPGLTIKEMQDMLVTFGSASKEAEQRADTSDGQVMLTKTKKKEEKVYTKIPLWINEGVKCDRLCGKFGFNPDGHKACNCPNKGK